MRKRIKEQILIIGLGQFGMALTKTLFEKGYEVIAVALLKQMGCENIVARASEAIHARILKAIGAKRIINPEYEYGKKFAHKIMFKSIFLENNSDELELFEIPVLPFMIGKTLKELQFSDKYNIIVAGVMKDNKYTKPLPDEEFKPEDWILVTGTSEDIEKLTKENR